MVTPRGRPGGPSFLRGDRMPISILHLFPADCGGAGSAPAAAPYLLESRGVGGAFPGIRPREIPSMELEHT